MDIVQKSLTIKDNEKLRTRAPMRISFAEEELILIIILESIMER